MQDYWNHTFPTGQCKKVNATGRCDGLCAIDFNNNSGAHGDLQVLGASFQGKYSARVFSTEAVREIEQHASESSERGFFLYLAMQSVHGPWEAPDESVAVFSDHSVNGVPSLSQTAMKRMTIFFEGFAAHFCSEVYVIM